MQGLGVAPSESVTADLQSAPALIRLHPAGKHGLGDNSAHNLDIGYLSRILSSGILGNPDQVSADLGEADITHSQIPLPVDSFGPA